MDEQLNKWTARFASPATESVFQNAKYEGDKGNNFRALLLAIPIFAGYAVLDYSMLGEATDAVKFRVSSCLFAALLLVAFKHPTIGKFQEQLTCAITMVMSCTLFFILHTQGNIDHNYYVGLIQGGVFVCFLLRVGFISAVAVLTFYLLGFIGALSEHLGSDEVRAQIFILLSMFLICAFGNYLLQRYRRNDFLQSQTIEVQNKQLKILLKDVEKDNERKIAAMNTLVHFVKTPLHQISGFSDVVLNNLTAENSVTSNDEGVNGARYIKEATESLSRNVNGLLTYHRLDEIEGRQPGEAVNIDNLVGDMRDLLRGDAVVEFEATGEELVTSKEAVAAAVGALAAYYNEKKSPAMRLAVEVQNKGTELDITVRDDLEPLAEAEFSRDTQPLTKLDSYLNCAGSDMPMALRTVSRAVEIAGGSFSHRADGQGNMFIISLDAMREKAASNKAA